MANPPNRLAPPERRAWRGMVGATAVLRRRLARHLQRDSDLSPADYEVLVNLDKAPGSRLRVLELAAVMDWEKSRLSKHLARMVVRGQLERERCPTDARGAVVVLTDAGRAAFDEAERLHLAHVRRLFLDALTADQLESLAEITEAVLHHIEALDAASAAETQRMAEGP